MRTGKIHRPRATSPLKGNQVRGEFVHFEGAPWYQIHHYDQMPPFFLSVVSAEDHWMFLSSCGGVTAGRRDADHALFPYFTDDKIRDQAEVTGGKTILRVRRGGKMHVWEPLCKRGEGRFQIRRSLGKCVWGNQVLFEEENLALGLVFRSGWFNSQKYGWIRRSWLKNTGRTPARLEFLDGIQNVMPSGIGSEFQLRFSTLLDAYKRNELVAGSRLALFRLSAVPADRPEPAECLSTTVAWSVAPGTPTLLLSSRQLEVFRSGGRLQGETDVCGQRGAYFLAGTARLGPGRELELMIGADVCLSAADVARVRERLRQPAKFRKEVLADIQEGTAELRSLVGSADGFQTSALPMGSARHYSNTLCNIMRGGVFSKGETVRLHDLDRFFQASAPAAIPRWKRLARTLPAQMSYPDLIRKVRAWDDPNLERICREYLPLTFSRRHGDPSRPWNRFTIPQRDSAGNRVLNYEGNWRDIFQNWEALAHSYPSFTTGMITRFLNATTADGYNPYRITREGIDWEVPDPHDPWACIGYWGDHQIIYLLKLLEHQHRHHSAELESLWDREIFVYANVPYRIRDYPSLVNDPKNTVDFDRSLAERIHERVRIRGAEGKLLWNRQGGVIRANLAEKLLIPLLAKLSNFVPAAGIWLNTQRPEWNDANNALVGQGTSVVTLAYLRRYLTFLASLVSASPRQQIFLCREVGAFLSGLAGVFAQNRSCLARKISNRDRRRLMDLLGKQGALYRKTVYQKGLSAKKLAFSKKKILSFLSQALAWTDASLQANRRKDGLYHAYNLLTFEKGKGTGVRHLYEMLEGQVAIMSSGLLKPTEVIALLRSLRQSAMYRRDQHSYLLYPHRSLPAFLERNNLPAAELRRCRILRRLITDKNLQLVEKDVVGKVHFRPGIGSQRDLAKVLDQLGRLPRYRELIQRERPRIFEIYEKVFDHQSFTGRSGTFYGYEGLGCIYWHMVSKLLLAVQEVVFRAEREGFPANVRKELRRAYYEIRAGLGDAKPPQAYGAFPMDPYSHTPAHAGAKQPGLTGQVKEDILSRFGELGVFVEAGKIQICPILLRRAEFCEKPGQFEYHGPDGVRRLLDLPEKSLAFTFCQTPFVYRLGVEDRVVVTWSDGTRSNSGNQQLDSWASQAIFRRTGLVRKVEVSLRPQRLLGGLDPGVSGKT